MIECIKDYISPHYGLRFKSGEKYEYEPYTFLKYNGISVQYQEGKSHMFFHEDVQNELMKFGLENTLRINDYFIIN